MSQDSPFLALPPELRNAIYELVIGDDEKVKFFNGRTTTSSFALAATCRQIRDDFTPVWRHAVQTAKEVEATVTDFNFDGLTRFYKQLQRSPLGRTRKVTVTINLIGRPQVQPDKTAETSMKAVQAFVQPLQDWLRQCPCLIPGVRGRDSCGIEYVVRVDWLRWPRADVMRLAWDIRHLFRSRGCRMGAMKVLAAIVKADRELDEPSRRVCDGVVGA